MNNFESLKNILIITAIIFVLPVMVCVLFKYTSLTNIGPIVFFYSLISLPIFATIYSVYLNTKMNHYIGTTIGIGSGVFTAVLILNFFMAATYYAGIMNYDPM